MMALSRAEQPAAPLPARLKGAALALAALMVAATAVLWLAGIPAQRESYLVNLLGTLLFITASSILIALMSIRSFLRTGAWPVLWLGAGALAFGLGVPLSNLFLARFGPNAGVTMHNLAAFVAAALHLIGAFFAVNRIPAQEPGRRRASAVRQVYGATLLVIALVAAGAALGRLPAFFIQGQGGTPLRQLVVGIDTVLFFLAGLVFLRHYAAARTTMIYWYALGLMLISLGLAGILLISATGTPLNWIGRAAQWLGGVYLLVAAWATWREAKAAQRPTGDVLASYFVNRESNLRLLFDSVPDAIVLTDHNLRITYWNTGAERIYGWRADEAVGRPARDLVAAQWPDGGAGRNGHALPAGSTWRDEVIERTRDGRQIAVLASVSAVRDELGRIIGHVAVSRDVTEQRAANEEIRRLNAGLAERAQQLEASNHELEAFAYSVSHDLRAPLRAVAGYAEALDEDCGAQLDATGREYVAALRLNAHRMGELIDDLLALSRVGRQQIERVRVDPVQVARAAWDELAAEWAGRRIDLRFPQPERGALPATFADPTLLKQLWINLLSNAIKFTRGRDPAVIEIGHATPVGPPGAGVGPPGAGSASSIYYYVRDNGIGFDMEHAERLFALFHRLHRAEEYEGTGVGLAIALRVAQRHGGRMWAEGEPGRGAAFYFTLGDGSVGQDA